MLQQLVNIQGAVFEAPAASPQQRAEGAAASKAAYLSRLLPGLQQLVEAHVASFTAHCRAHPSVPAPAWLGAEAIDLAVLFERLVVNFDVATMAQVQPLSLLAQYLNAVASHCATVTPTALSGSRSTDTWFSECMDCLLGGIVNLTVRLQAAATRELGTTGDALRGLLAQANSVVFRTYLQHRLERAEKDAAVNFQKEFNPDEDEEEEDEDQSQFEEASHAGEQARDYARLGCCGASA